MSYSLRFSGRCLQAAFHLGLSPMLISDGTFAPASKFSIQSLSLTSIRFHQAWKDRSGMRGNGCTTWRLESLIALSDCIALFCCARSSWAPPLLVCFEPQSFVEQICTSQCF